MQHCLNILILSATTLSVCKVKLLTETRDWSNQKNSAVIFDLPSLFTATLGHTVKTRHVSPAASVTVREVDIKHVAD